MASLLIRGSVGPDVRKLQEDLNTIGVTVDVDGTYGHGTEQAVRTFQTSAGLKVDGAAGPNTLSKLAEMIASLPPATPAAS